MNFRRAILLGIPISLRALYGYRVYQVPDHSVRTIAPLES
jgi:hypothetical protein